MTFLSCEQEMMQKVHVKQEKRESGRDIKEYNQTKGQFYWTASIVYLINCTFDVLKYNLNN